MFRYYTQNSNLFAFEIAVVCAMVTIICLFKGKREPSEWTKHLRHTAVTCLMVTFLVACLVIVPSDPRESFYSFMIKGDNIYIHTLCPLLMLTYHLAFTGFRKYRFRHAVFTGIPTVLYGSVNLCLVYQRKLPPPYPFFNVHGQKWYITTLYAIAIPFGSMLLAYVIGKLGIRKRRDSIPL